jgi:hypothetical protein
MNEWRVTREMIQRQSEFALFSYTSTVVSRTVFN